MREKGHSSTFTRKIRRSRSENYRAILYKMADNSHGWNCFGCNGKVTVGQSQRSWMWFRIGAYLFLILALFAIPKELYEKWNRLTPDERLMYFGFYAAEIGITVLLVFPFRRCCQKIFKRKRIIFWSKSSTVSLKSALANLQRYILTEEKAKEIEREATSSIKVISQHISNSFQGNQIKFSLTGGFAEGYGVPLWSKWLLIEGEEKLDKSHALISDFDFMFELENIFAGYDPSDDVDFLITTRDCQLGFTKLMVHNQDSGSRFGCDGEYLSAKFVKQKIYTSVLETDMEIYPGFKNYLPLCCLRSSNEHYVETKISGPAIKLKICNTGVSHQDVLHTGKHSFSDIRMNSKYQPETNHLLADITFSIWCKEFPRSSNFNKRNDRRWPKPEDVERIVNMGCHLVPKSQEENDTKELTWRFSFSKAEVELSKLINYTARKCFLALKVISKDHLSFTCSRLSSYHLKTIFLNMVEETGLEAWTEENIETMFRSLLGEVKSAIDSKRCQHFWIPEINLFEDIPDRKLFSLSKIFDKVLENPAPYIQHKKKVDDNQSRDVCVDLEDVEMIGNNLTEPLIPRSAR
ncbi:uncharacterized protein [Clytia hemisphaerica]|uniref:uncharacterized protein n=1 Tax=Clytia hemisphaerica TaxID=252671 RepID=UPI0034D438C0